MKIKTIKVIDVSDFDQLVQKTYGKMYSFQQQEGCKERGMYPITVPEPNPEYYDEEIVSLEDWIATPNDEHDKFAWQRDFYPSPGIVINDLYKKGLLEKGEYSIEVDW